MKFIFIFISAILALLYVSCKDEISVPIYNYTVSILQPDSLPKHLGDTLDINVEFVSHTGEAVHHINVRIFNKATNAEVYNLPVEPHVHDVTGSHTYSDQFVLSAAHGLSEGDWVLEGKVWGHEDSIEETTSRVEFHINP